MVLRNDKEIIDKILQTKRIQRINANVKRLYIAVRKEGYDSQLVTNKNKKWN